MDSRIQLYFRGKGLPPNTGIEIKSEHYENDRKLIKEAACDWIDDQLNYLDQLEVEDDN